MLERSKIDSNYILHISSYPPRECGIATFTEDLILALNKKFNPVIKMRIAALNNEPSSLYNYNNQVLYQMTATELEHYVSLAREINERDDIKIVNIQHEFGLFGGEWGDYLIPFLQVIEKPVVVTLHSVLSNPDEKLLNVVKSITARAKSLVVMNRLSEEILQNEYGIPKSKIAFIPHGIPQVSFEPTDKAKAELSLDGRTILSTFGMINRNKGIEYAIRALRPVADRFPDVLYLVIGATHPNIRREEGETYRNSLVSEVERLGLNNNVKFYNKYLTLDEIVQYLKATDIYVSSQVDIGQSVSGTLSYALGAGRPIISTPTEYAKFIIDDTNGILVKTRNHDSLAGAIINLLSDPKKMKSMNQSAYEKSRQMIWPNVAVKYFNLYKKYADIESEERKLPEMKLDHLTRLSDGFGIFHHAKYSKPEKRYGYSLDDNVRALLVSAKYFAVSQKQEMVDLMKTYIKFIKFVSRRNGYFANIVSMHKKHDNTKDEDVLGRTIWVLGYTASANFLPEDIRKETEDLLRKPFQIVSGIKSPRAIAFALIGLYHYLKVNPKKSLVAVFNKLADRQTDFFEKTASLDWQWFENEFTYSNSKLPESLFYAYDLTKNKKYLRVASASLDFLSQITYLRNRYVPIGQNGWYFRSRRRAYYDQQPEDAASMVETKIVAYKSTKDKRQLEEAYTAFQWFLGKNHLNQMVYDEVTGGCHDGVGQYAINLNEGAESTISYLLARLAFEDLEIKNEVGLE